MIIPTEKVPSSTPVEFRTLINGTLFSQSELIGPIFPQAAQLDIRLFIIFISQHTVKDALPFEGPD